MSSVSIIAQNLLYLMDKMGLTANLLKDKSGITQTTTSRILNGSTKNPRDDVVQKYADFFGVSVADLRYTDLSSQDVENYALGNVEPINPNTETRYAPVLNYVQAGLFTEIGDNAYDEYLAYNNDKVGNNAYWLIVKGDSMTPDFQEGDLLLVDADRQPKSGDYVIAKVADDNEATFKRYKACGFDDKLNVEYCQLIALNEFYSPIDSRYKSFVVLGVVMEHKRRFYV